MSSQGLSTSLEDVAGAPPVNAALQNTGFVQLHKYVLYTKAPLTKYNDCPLKACVYEVLPVNQYW